MKRFNLIRERFNQRRNNDKPVCLACVLMLGTLAVCGFVWFFARMGWL